MSIAKKKPSVKGGSRGSGRGAQANPLRVMSTPSIAAKLEETEGELPRLTTRRVLLVHGFGFSLLLGSSAPCRAGSQSTKEGHEFFDPDKLPWHPAPGHGPGVWERIVSGGQDAGVTTRFLRFDPGSGRDEVVTHDFWEEIYIVSGTFESGGQAYPAGYVAVRPLERRMARFARPVDASILKSDIGQHE